MTSGQAEDGRLRRCVDEQSDGDSVELRVRELVLAVARVDGANAQILGSNRQNLVSLSCCSALADLREVVLLAAVLADLTSCWATSVSSGAMSVSAAV
jgi:hypothetical protein